MQIIVNDHKIRIFDKDGQELQSDQINWNSLDAVNYKFRQDPGGDLNSLGVVRININNPYGVYMHDTPEKGIFGDDDRFVSSGCIRVQNVRDYVTWLLKDTPGWDRAHIDEVIRSGERVDAKLAAPGSGVLGLYYGLGDTRGSHRVPRGYLSARRLYAGYGRRFDGSAPAIAARRRKPRAVSARGAACSNR